MKSNINIHKKKMYSDYIKQFTVLKSILFESIQIHKQVLREIKYVFKKYIFYYFNKQNITKKVLIFENE